MVSSISNPFSRLRFCTLWMSSRTRPSFMSSSSSSVLRATARDPSRTRAYPSLSLGSTSSSSGPSTTSCSSTLTGISSPAPARTPTSGGASASARRGLRYHHDLPQGLSGLYSRRVAGCPAQGHDPPRRLHPPRELFVHEGLVRLWPLRQVHALGCRLVGVHDEVLVEGFGDERGEGGAELCDADETLVKGGVGGLFVQVVLTLPEPAAAPPDVPVRELIHELAYRTPGSRHVVGVEPLGYGLRGELELAQGPAVDEASLVRVHVVFVRVEAVYPRVGDEEGVSVPEGEEVLADGFVDLVLAEAPGVAGVRGGVERPTESIGALFTEDLPGVHDVSPALAHLLPLGVEDVPEHHARLIRTLTEEHRRGGQKGVEPPPRLVHRLANEVGRKGPFEGFLSLERVVPLGERHATRVEPRVQDLGDALRLCAALPACHPHPVHIRAVKVAGDVTEGVLL